MNTLESQVSDLNYLAESPLPSMNGQHQSPESSAEGNNVDGARGTNPSGKRKADDGGGSGSAPQTRAKRNRYISIACNECKRRKIKCNGNTPCQRCGHLNLECQYAPNCCSFNFKESDEFKHMNAQISSLQEQVDNLFANMSALRSGGEHIGFAPHSDRAVSMGQTTPGQQAMSPMGRYRPTPKHPSFRGPSSSTYNLEVAKNTLQNMGYQSLTDEGATAEGMGASPPAAQQPYMSSGAHGSHARDPLWRIEKEEMIRLCRVYEEEMGIMYPVISIELVIQHGIALYDFADSVRAGMANPPSPQTVNDDMSCVLKMILAISMVVEGSGESEPAYRFFENVREAADRTLHSGAVEIKSLPFLVLVAIYHFHCDEEALAWRIIGQVARMCIELGLHRRDSLFKIVVDEEERISVLKLFWSIYVLDRRWSFGTGMPFAIQDADIDPNLPEPELSPPYLNAMISYSRIGSKVWRSISSFKTSPDPPLNIEEIGFLDYKIIQWQKSIAPELQLPTAAAPQTSSRAIHRLQILIYLRANQMRILIYRPVLHNASSIHANLNYAHIVVELAKDTIRALTHLNQTTDIYRVQQVCFNYFLISALAVIFLASCHAPVTFSSICREEFYMALDLVKGFSNKSFVSKRLWRTIKSLKEVGPKLGLQDPTQEDPHSSAALAMAGLAGHEISGLGGGGGGGGGGGNGYGAEQGLTGQMGTSPINGNQMSYEMTHLFEAALGMGGMGGNGGQQFQGMQGTEAGDMGNMQVGGTAFDGGDVLYRSMGDLF